MSFTRRPEGLKCLQFMILLAGFLLVSFPNGADRVQLQGGATMEGKVPSQNDPEVTLVLDGGGSMTLPRSLVESVHIDSPPPAPQPPSGLTPVEVQQVAATPTPTPPPEPPALPAIPSPSPAEGDMAATAPSISPLLLVDVALGLMLVILVIALLILRRRL